jgi:hypothetical protein
LFQIPTISTIISSSLKLLHPETLNSFLIVTECSEIYIKAETPTMKVGGELARSIAGRTLTLAFFEQMKILLSCSSSFIHKTTNFIT